MVADDGRDVPDVASDTGYRYPGRPVQRFNEDGEPVMLNGQPNPTGRGRYCAPRACTCGGCPSYRPLPHIDFVAAAKKLARRRIRTVDDFTENDTEEGYQ